MSSPLVRPRDHSGHDPHGTLVPGDAHDQALVANVHPPDWANPEPADVYNVVVLGAGTAGLVTAAAAAGLGARVALVERALLGGDCLNTGCVPSKGLIRAARAAFDVRDAGRFGVHVDGARVDFGHVMERMRRLRAGISAHDSAERFRALGVDVFLGEARFTSADRVEVGGATLRFRRAVIATGARAATLPVPGLAEVGFLTNENVFALRELPRRLAVVGAGPIGCELAQTFRRLGSDVTVVALDPRVLPRDDPDASRVVQASLERDGVVLRLGSRLVRAEAASETAKRLVHDRGLGEEHVEADEILLAVGRQPNVEGLGLENAGVAFDPRRGVEVDDRLRTSNPRIHAAGDVATPYKFTHAADAMARIVVQNALFFLRKRQSALVIPWTTYTDPEVAHVGMTAAEADERDEVLTITEELSGVDRAILEGDDEGFAKLHVARKGGRLLGATLVSRHAGESIGELALAIGKRLTAADLDATIHPYPTVADVWRRAGTAYQRTRLSPGLQGLLQRWFRWLR